MTSWDGEELRRQELAPGTHMIAHDDVDDESTPRIRAWLPVFADASTDDGRGGWWLPWTAVLARSAELSPTDDRAIVRDNRGHGYPTLSLLACVASVGQGESDVRYAALEHAGEWNALSFE
jgi:hypothetical protein